MRTNAAKLLVLLIGLALLCAGLQGPAVAGKIMDRLAKARLAKEDYKSPAELAAQHERELRRGRIYLKLMSGDPRDKSVALTFDDGPHPQYTPKLLAILKQYNIKATFFVVGKMAKQYPNLIKAEYAAGHVVGNHTYDHVNLNRIPINLVAAEWKKCNDLIMSILNVRMKYCRPPGGDYDHDVIMAAQQQRLITVLWTDDPGDYAHPGDKVIERRVLDKVRNGAIILIHDGVQQTIDVLPQIIETLQKRGFRFITVDEMTRDHMARRL